MLSASSGIVSEDVVRSKGRGVRALELDFEVFFFFGNETHFLVLFGGEMWLMVGGLRSESFGLVLWEMRVSVCS
jgi:hypothetical protein